jgi:hypothetical protein
MRCMEPLWGYCGRVVTLGVRRPALSVPARRVSGRAAHGGHNSSTVTMIKMSSVTPLPSSIRLSG